MMIKHAWKRCIVVVVVSCAALVSGPAQATDYTWTGTSSANISDTANWSPVPGGAFAMTDALIFPAGVTITNLINTSVQTIASITFQAGAHPYTLSGSNFKYAHVTNESAANQTILNKLDWQQFSRSYVNNGSGPSGRRSSVRAISPAGFAAADVFRRNCWRCGVGNRFATARKGSCTGNTARSVMVSSPEPTA